MGNDNNWCLQTNQTAAALRLLDALARQGRFPVR
jgi:hypothetical protein